MVCVAINVETTYQVASATRCERNAGGLEGRALYYTGDTFPKPFRLPALPYLADHSFICQYLNKPNTRPPAVV